ncbi:MAG: penicillin acylase family protein [Ignavibacteriaceae bacterium]
MPKWIKVLIGLTVSFIIIFLVGGYFIGQMLKASLPEYSGELKTSSIKNNIDVYRDSLAVPYIFADSDEDAAFALGYLHAQERMFTMDLIRRAGEGRLSEILGEKTIPFDKMFRTVGIKRNIEKNFDLYNPDVLKILKSYSAGVNLYIAEAKGKYPIEFDVLGYDPYEWEPIHSLIIVRLLGWELNMSWWVDFTFAQIVQKFGKEKALEILPDYPENAPYIIQSDYKKLSVLNSSLIETDKQYRKFLGISGTHLGSNNWVVNSKMSASGRPIIANDPHLAFSAPGKFYAAVIKSNSWNAAGVTIPGIPGIVIGKNENISWTMTNLMNDDGDFYIETIDSSGKNYLLNNNWKDLKVFKDTIKVKGANDYVYEIKETHRGPIISDIHPGTLLFSEEQIKMPPISMKWLGNDFSDELNAFLNLNKAKNIPEVKSAMKDYRLPGQNFVIADNEGNIGYVFGASVPLRKSNNPTLIFDGTTTENDWLGFVPYDELPYLINPPQNFIATANNKVIKSFKYHISNLWEPSSRIDRILELIQSKEIHSKEDFMDYQMDINSPYAKQITEYILNAFKGIQVQDKNLIKSLELLSEWDYEMNSMSQAPAIYSTFLMNLLKNTYYDELGKELYNQFVFIANVPFRSILQVLENPDSPWFDNLNTREKETRDMILRKSFADALTELENKLGKNVANWQWGNLHKVIFKHSFSGQASIIDNFINIGPFSVGGDGTTLFNTEYPFSEPNKEIGLLNHEHYENILGPQIRFICDYNNPDEFYLILSTGQSGNIMSNHYSDMTQLWLEGKYMKIRTDETSIKNNNNNLFKFLAE